MDQQRIELLAIGDELLDGRVVDQNGQVLAGRLAERGTRLAQISVVSDDPALIVDQARAIVSRGTQLCVVSGGLGPTSDDLTREAFALLAGVQLIRDEQVAANIEARLRARGRTITPNQFRQAERPAGADMVPNPGGMAPGFSLRIEKCRFVCLPGVPDEFVSMLTESVLNTIELSSPLQRQVLWTFGLIEAEIDSRLDELRKKYNRVRFGYRIRFPETQIVLSALEEKQAQLAKAVEQARECLTPHDYQPGHESLAAAVCAELRRWGATLAVAESCTGGLVGDLLTDVPGSSESFRLSVVAYSNAAKSDVLGISTALLAKHGAVSQAVVKAMAQQVRMKVGATFGLGVSGIAGPGGGTPDKPVGTVWLAGVGPGWETTSCLHLPFDRQRNKRFSAFAVLDLLRRYLMNRTPEGIGSDK